MRIDLLNRRFLRAICIAICVGYLIAGLWPFNFLPRNHVTWPQDGKGVSLARNSIIYSERALELRQNAGAVTIELYLQPPPESARNLASIVSLYDGELPENLALAQRGSELLLRMADRDARGERKSQQVGVNAGLRPGIRRFIVITSGGAGTAVYVDGILTGAYPKLTVRPDILRGRLILGSAPQGRLNWQGRLLGLAIFSRPLAPSEISHHNNLWMGDDLQALPSAPGLLALYFFNEGSGRAIQDHSPSRIPLLIPRFYRALHRTVLVLPWKDSRDTHDIVINIVGFVPFGFFYFFYRMQTADARILRNVVMTALVAGIISTAIELLQAYLPTRASQLTDIILNVGGSLIGVLLAAAALSVIQSRAPDPQK